MTVAGAFDHARATRSASRLQTWELPTGVPRPDDEETVHRALRPEG
jgi:hypothetical protein